MKRLHSMIYWELKEKGATDKQLKKFSTFENLYDNGKLTLGKLSDIYNKIKAEITKAKGG